MWQNVIGTLGGGVALMAALVWLVQTLVKHSLSKDIESYKEQLAEDRDRSISELKTELTILAQEHQIRFSKLHEKRADIIDETYRLLQIAKRRFDVLGVYARCYYDGIDNVAPDAVKSLKEFREFYLLNRLYFGSDLCGAADRFVKLLSKPIDDYEMWERDGKLPEGYRGEMVRLCNQAQTEVPSLSEIIEQEFRSMLGVRATSPAP